MKRYFLVRMLLALLVLVGVSAVAEAATITGNVINNSGRSGRIYLSLYNDSMGTGSGGSTNLGVSIPSSGDFTIRGVSNGTFKVFAWVDVTGTGERHANDPFRWVPGITVSNGASTSAGTFTIEPVTDAITSAQVTLDPEMPMPFLPSIDGNGVGILYKHPRGVRNTDDPKANDNEKPIIAEAYNVACVKNGSEVIAPITAVAIDDFPPIVTGLAAGNTLGCTITPVLNGTPHAPSAHSFGQTPVGTFTQGGLTTITGTVTFAGGTPSGGTLLVVINDDNGMPAIWTKENPNATETYTIPQVEPGRMFNVYVWYDANNNKVMDPGDLQSDESLPPRVMVENIAGIIQAAPITLDFNQKSYNRINTEHQIAEGGEQYSLRFDFRSNRCQVANVTLKPGTGSAISENITVGNEWGQHEYSAWNIPRPNDDGSETYLADIEYIGCAAATNLPLSPLMVLDTYVVPTFPVGTVRFDADNTASWQTPSPLPAILYNYGAFGGFNWDDPLLLPTDHAGVLKDTSQGFWHNMLQVIFGDTVKSFAPFTVSATGPQITDVYVTGQSGVRTGPAGTAVTITGSGFTGATEVSFNGVSQPSFTVGGLGTTISTTVPAGAVTGPILVTAGGVTTTSGKNLIFTPTISHSGTLTKFIGGAAIPDDNGKVHLIGAAPATDAETTGGNGSYSIANTVVPAGIPYMAKASASGYHDAYGSFTKSVTDVSASNFQLFTTSDLEGWVGFDPLMANVADGSKAMITARTVDIDNGNANLSGVKVHAYSWLNKGAEYPVRYSNRVDQAPVSGLSATQPNGRYYVLDVVPGDFVTIEGEKNDYVFGSRIFTLQGGSIGQGRLNGSQIQTNFTVTPNSGAHQAPLTVALSPNAPAVVYYTTNGNNPVYFGTACAGDPCTITFSNAGDYNLRYALKASNGMFVQAGSAVYNVTVDTTPPTVTAAPAGGYVNAQPINVMLTSSEPATIYYTTNGANPTSGASPSFTATAGNLTVGPVVISTSGTTLKYFAVDLAGNPSTIVTVPVYYIDLVSPNTFISPAPPAFTAAGDGISFSFFGTDAASGVASYECRLDTEAYSLCTSPKNYTWVQMIGVFSGNMDGSHTFQVRAIDRAGNVDASPASHTWTIDTVKPEITAATPPSNPYNSQTIPVTITASDATSGIAAYLVTTTSALPSLSDPNWSAANPFSYVSAVTGNLSLFAWVRDVAGNLSNGYPFSVTVDTVLPSTTASPPGGTQTGPVNVFLTVNEPATIYYTTNGADPTTASPFFTDSVGNVAQGPIAISTNTTLKYFAKDLAGNSETPIKQQVYFYGIATTLSVIVDNPLITYGADVTAEAIISPPVDGGTFTFYVDGVLVGTVNAPAVKYEFDFLPAQLPVNGSPHQITASYSGNATYASSTTPTAATVTVTKATPMVTVISASANPSTFSQPVSFTATVSPSDATGTIQFKVDGVDINTPVALSGGSATSSAYCTGGIYCFDGIIKMPVGNHTITAIYSGDTNLTSATSGGYTQTVNPGPLHHLAVSVSSPQTAGVAANITVTAQDQWNNTITDYTGTVYFTSSDSQAILPADYSFVAGDNGTHNFTGGLTLKTAGSQTVTATDTVTSTLTGTTGPISVNPGSATHFNVAAPSSVTAGTAFNVTVTARDAYENTTSFGGGINFTSTDPAASLPPWGVAIGTRSITLYTAGSWTVSVTDFSTGTIGGTSGAIAVAPAAAATFDVTAPASTTAGSAFSVTVTAKDAYGNIANGYRGSMFFLSPDPQADLPASYASPYTFTGADNGTHTFTNVTLKTAGSQNVNVHDTINSMIGGVSPNITVVPASPSKLVFSGQPSNAVSQVAIAPAVQVAVQDQYGNVVTGSSASIVMAIGTNPGSGTLSGTLTKAAVNGIATFSDLSLDKAVAGYTLSASSAGLAGATSSTFTITPGPLHHFAISTISTQTAMTPFSVIIAALDAAGNTATSFTGTANLTITGGSTISPTTTAAFINGGLALNVTVSVAGTGRAITATRSGGSESGTSNTFDVNLASQMTLTVTGMPVTAQAYGTTFTVGTSGGSGTGAISYSATGACSVDPVAGLVTITSGTGTCSVTASKDVDSNYNSTISAPATVAAAQAALTITADAKTKVYGDIDPALTYVVTGTVYTGDSVSGSLTRAAGETVTGGPYQIQQGSVTAGSNYLITYVSADLTITQKPLTITGITAADKTYDGTTTATLSGSPTLNGIVGTDDVAINGSATGNFDNKNVGTNKTVNFTGLTLTGTTAGNYSISGTASTTADITAKSVTVSGARAANKTYDSTTTATVTSLGSWSGVIDADIANVTLTGPTTGSFADANAAVGKTVTITGLGLTGPEAGNYILASTSTTATATILQRPLTITADAKTKIYGSVDPALTYQLTSGTLVGTDTLSGTLTRTAGETVGASPYTILQGGVTAGSNYLITYVSADLTITQKPLTITGITAADKTYDGTTTATLSGSPTLNGIVGTDDVAINGSATGNFDNKNVGTNKTVNFTGLTLTGTTAGNYSITGTASTTASINAKSLTINAGTATAASKTYDGTTTASITGRGTLNGIVGADVVTLTGGTATFDSKDVGLAKTVTITGLTISGNDAGNYTLASGTTTATAAISQAALTVTADAKTKVYGDIDPALTYVVTGSVYTGDSVSGSLTRAAGETVTGGPYQIQQGSVTAGSNYLITYVAANLTITQKPLTITGITAADKTYDGTTTATLSGSPTLNGIVGTDDVAINGSATGNFDNKNVGTNKTVNFTGLTLTGTTAGNYSISGTASTTANITPAPLTVTANAMSKVYNTTDPILTYTHSALATGDTASVFTGMLTRVSGENVAGSPYAILQGTLTAGANYTITFTSAGFTITKATATVFLSDLIQTADGTPRVVTFTTNPVDLPVTITYEGSPAAPTAAGTYSVVATVDDPNYQGTASGTLTLLQYGDISGPDGVADGVVDITDALEYLNIAMHVTSSPAYTGNVLLAPIVAGKPAAVNGSRQVNISDALAVLEKIVNSWVW